MRLRFCLSISIFTCALAALAQEPPDVAGKVDIILQRAQPRMQNAELAPIIDEIVALGPAAVPALSRCITDNLADPKYRPVTEALKRMGAPAVDVLVDQLRHGATPQDRTSAINAIVGMKYAQSPDVERAGMPLVQALDDPDINKDTVERALSAVAPQSEEVYLILVRRMVEKGEDHSTVLQLIKTAPPEAIELLLKMLGSDDSNVGYHAASSLEALGPRLAPFAPKLIEMLNGEMSPGQSAIPRILIKALAEQAAPILVEALVAAKEQEVRHNILYQFDEHMEAPKFKEAAIEPLIAALSKDTFFAAYALSSIGAPAADALIAVTHSPDPLTRHNAIFALGQMKKAPPAVSSALEALLTREDLRDRCMAAMSLASIGGTDTTAVAIEKVMTETADADAKRILADALFNAGAVRPTEREKELPLYTLYKEQIQPQGSETNTSSYSIAFNETDKPIFLSNLEGSASENGIGFDEKSLRLEWVEPGRLLQTTWSTLVQGSGKYMITGILLVEKTEPGWREIYRHSGSGTSGGMGNGGSSDHYYQFLYNPRSKSLRFELLYQVWQASVEPLPLFVNTGSTHWSGKYNNYYAEIVQWPAELADSGVTTQPGTGVMRVKSYEFSPAEWAEYLKLPESELRKLNPHLEGRAVWSDRVYVKTAMQPHHPDHNVYLRDD